MMFFYAGSAFVHELLNNDENGDVFPWQTLFWYQMYNSLAYYDVIKQKSKRNSQ